MERFPRSEKLVTPEEKHNLYLNALKAKKEVLSLHNAMNLLRREVDTRIDKMSDEEFKNDPSVVEYKRIGHEYDLKRKLFSDLFGALSDEEKEKLAKIKNLKEAETELSSLNVLEAEEPGIKSPEEEISEAEIDKMIKYAKDTARPMELSYWESRKEELKNKQKKEKEITEAEIDKMIKYARDTGRLLELAYWESKKEELKNSRIIKRKPEEVQPKQKTEQAEERAEKIPDIESPELSEENVRERTKDEKPRSSEQIEEIQRSEEALPEVEEEPKGLVTEAGKEETEALLQYTEQEKGAITVEQKKEIDRIILEHPDNPAEFISETIVKKENVDKAVMENTNNAVDEAVVSLEDKKIAPQEKTILAKIRDRVKNKVAIYVGVGLLGLMALKSEAREFMAGAPSAAVKILDEVPDIGASVDLPKMMVDEAMRYSAKPYLVARYIGSNDYFGLEAIKVADTMGLEDTARDMYGKSLDEYIDNFSETRRANRFTTLDKHTTRSYIDAFVQIHAGQESPDSGIETYQKLKDFIQENFGAAKAYELALKVSSEKEISPALLRVAKKDLKEQGTILTQAIGKSNINFNQEEGTFRIIYKGHLIDTYSSRAGFMNVPKSDYIQSLGYGRTPDGQFTISSVERGYTTLRWRDSFLPYGAEIRIGENGEIEYKYRNQWFPATGQEATYFDQGNKIQPNKSEKDMRFLKERSKGESPLTKTDFITTNGLMTRWEKNPFGPISYRLAGRGELIHSNPNDSDNILHPSHGCIRLDKEDIRNLESYIGAGVSKIKITSEAGKSIS